MSQAEATAPTQQGPKPMQTETTISDKKEIYTYEAKWLVYGMNWSVRPQEKFRLAIGSFVEEYNNKVCVCLRL